ncbi:PH domain-containing protein [Streptomyces sp. B6B3]|uniref:PH domain-containing protein n=1 Tax=Streptomyces sp. B6B3 TaxID=3153570 RepID=UPI00325CCDBF
MTKESEFRTYCPASGLRSAGAPVVIPFTVLPLMAATRVSMAMLLLTAVVLGGVMALCYVALRRAGTTTHRDHIELRSPFSVRRVAWSDVQAIEIRDYKLMGQIARVRDASGRWLTLPHVNSNSVPSLPEEVRALRELWERLRGPDWAPGQH